MTKVIACINQKGGVGKTTTTANLGYTLGKMGKDVLLIDLDSQASLTNYFNVGLGEYDYYGIYEMLIKELRTVTEDEDEFLANASFEEICEKSIVRPTYLTATTKIIDGEKKMVDEDVEFGISLLPSVLALSDYELELGNSDQYSPFHLVRIIRQIIERHPYDYIIIDCNPSLGILTMNAIAAATDGILIPTNLDIMSTRGVVNLINRIVEVQTLMMNNGIDHMGIIGIVLNLYADRRTVDQAIKDDMERFYPFKIFKAQIPESVNAKKAALMGVTYAQIYKKAEDAYKRLADEFEERLDEMQKEGPQVIRFGDNLPNTTLLEGGEVDE